MKPKTKLQKIVVAASEKIAPITPEQQQWIFNNTFDSFFVISRITAFCLDCGHQWKDRSLLPKNVTSCQCPECGKKLHRIAKNDTFFKSVKYSAVIDVQDGFQVVRIFYVQKSMRKREAASYWQSEVIRHFISPDGQKPTTVSKSTNVMGSYYGDQWSFHSDLEVRSENREYRHSPAVLKWQTNPDTIYPKTKILPKFRRNGFKTSFYGMPPQFVFEALAKQPQLETLIKARQIALFKHGVRGKNLDKYWKAIKICIRNNYIVPHANDWTDYIDLLAFFGKDLHNAKYVCPDDLHREHNRYVEKKRRWDLELKYEEMKSQIDAWQKQYEKEKGKFFGITFKSGKIEISVMDTVKQVMEEGDALHHCVFLKEYHNKRNSLLLSARVAGKITETIEIDLQEMRINQARGLQNKPTKHHNKIVELTTQNLPVIAAAMRLKKTKKSVKTLSVAA